MKSRKPFVFINCAMSLDGKISTFERRQVKISSDSDLERVDRLRAESDAILVGMNTVVSDDPKLTVKSENLRRERLRRGLPENPIKICVGRADRIKLNSDFLDYGDVKLVFTTEDSDPRKIERLREKAEVHILGKNRVDFNKMLNILADRGVGKLMVEGGGTVNFRLLREGLVDEILVAVAPRIFGGVNSPTLVDGNGFSAEDAVDLKLLEVENLRSLLVLRYAVGNSRKYI
jgi:2,5-diamino-6-(ribosylamino)-4(3H)-pyrimidinone 5'-phosphate reductase